MPVPLPLCAQLLAPPPWRQIDLISDLHLQEGDPATHAAWQHYLTHTRADAVLILGDLFEVWAGDDCLLPDPADAPDTTSFEQACCATLRQAAQRCSIHFMVGNRDFLFGTEALAACGMQGLPDPTVLSFGQQRYLLTHGDALCLDDVEYQLFRRQVRDPQWQQALLARPLSQRRELARHIRTQSESRKQDNPYFADADLPSVSQWLADSGCQVMIHGHTHRPADHAVDCGHHRWVLSDWDMAAHPPRAQVLRLTLDDGSGEVLATRLNLNAAVAAH